MHDTKNDSLSKAIAYLGAVEVIDTRADSAPDADYPTVYAFPSQLPDVAPWRICDASTLVMLHEAHLHYAKSHAFDIFVARTKKMPDWWTPEQRWTYKCPDCGVYAGEDPDASKKCSGAAWKRITADLQTGAEISA
jgi:hypothetical protein